MATPAPPYRVRITDPVVHMLRPGEIADHPLQHKSHPPQQRDAMAALCREVGIAGVLLVYHSPSNAGALTAIDGHLRKSLDPHQPWPCVMLDVDDDEAAYLLLTHDEIGRLAELLRQQTSTLLDRVRSQEGAVQDLLTQLREREGILTPAALPGPVLEVEPEIDRAEELRAQYGVEVGQLWQCGPHRVLCGDCTQQAAVHRLMDGTRIDLVLTSPPYAVGKEYEQHVSFPEHLAMLRDCADRCLEIVRPGGFLFVNFSEIAPQSHAGPLTGSERQCLYLISKDYWQIFHEERRCDLYAQRIWYKPFNRLQQPFWTYHTSIPHHQEWEHLWTWRVPGGDGDEVYDWDVSVHAVWDTRQEATDDKPLTRHTAAFPVGIPERALRAHSQPGGQVYDPFLGSGTTMIVCEQLQRCCYGMEIDPGYVAVSLHRWHQLTGQTPQLVRDVSHG